MKTGTEIEQYVRKKLEKVRGASLHVAELKREEKVTLLHAMADSLKKNLQKILEANQEDLHASTLPESLRDRLLLSENRVLALAESVREIAALHDPVGEVVEEITRPNGLRIQKVRVPLGVIGVIYESRPNVTVDAAVLCIKSSNAVILRGGTEAIRSNTALVNALQVPGLPDGAIEFIDLPEREAAQILMTARGFVDLLIPRGGEDLIRYVTDHATVPVIETGAGNCHIFVDKSANLELAEEVIVNAKTQRPGVCNAAEKLLVHEMIAEKFLPRIVARLQENGVTVKGDESTRRIVRESAAKSGFREATGGGLREREAGASQQAQECLVGQVLEAGEEDWPREYLDLIMAVRVVKDVGEAISHINRYSTKHSEAILTEDPASAEAFMKKVDSSSLYWNASTRFTDGGEFGLGGEIGISTQKLHARGPMSLRELTSAKYLIFGSGQIRK